ncbi:MAG: hypothetical protein K8T20_15595 [Planctomycetes bacterium]|nr:hypothetical protein [Planctomycetota bacterium]
MLGLAAMFAGCTKPPTPPLASPTASLATRFEERLASPDPFPEAEALAFIRILGPSAAPALGRPPVPADPSRRRLRARLLASAAQAGIRDSATFALALAISSDPDDETRWAARDTLLWSRKEWAPSPWEWQLTDPYAKSIAIDREYALPTFDTSLSWLQRDIAASATDPRVLPRYHDRMALVNGSAGVDRLASLQVNWQEQLWWLVQSARAGEEMAVYRLEQYMEPEPNVELGRVPSEEERRLANWGLASSPGWRGGRWPYRKFK